MFKSVFQKQPVCLVLLFSSVFFTVPVSASIPLKTLHLEGAVQDTTKLTKNLPVSAVKPAVADTTWKPLRRFWGLAFGDFYYNTHADAGNRGTETNYNNVPANRNAFQFRRIYLGYDYDIDRKFSVEVLLAAEPNGSNGVSGSTGITNGDNLADNKLSFFIKLLNLRWKNIWKGSDLVVGQMFTPVTVLLTEKIWGYRSVEKTIADFHRTNLFDLGAALQGNFDPDTKNFGYNLMIGNNTAASLLPAANPNTGFFKAVYGDVYAKFLHQSVIVDLYADYMQTASSTGETGQQSHNMFKGFVAYTTPKITFGLEAFTNKITNGLTGVQGNTKTVSNATVEAFSVYSHGAIYKDRLGFFARYDSYNPDSEFNAAETYTVNTNFATYSPFTKEHFITAGLDFTPSKNVHFMPNLWLINYSDQRDQLATGYVPNDHVMVYRLTFNFMFGK